MVKVYIIPPVDNQPVRSCLGQGYLRLGLVVSSIDYWWTCLWLCLCMKVWSRDPNSSRLTRNTSPPKFEPRPDLVMAQPTSLQDGFYPIRISLPSCTQLPSVGEYNFELKSQFINTLPKFHSLESEDAYFFIREFEKVWLMMKISHLLG